MIGSGFKQFEDVLGFKLKQDEQELKDIEMSFSSMFETLDQEASSITMFCDNAVHLFDLDMYSELVKSSVENFGISCDKYTAFMDANNNASAGILERIKVFFKNLWEKLKEYFGKFLDWVRGGERVFNDVKQQIDKVDSNPLLDDQLRAVADVMVAKPELLDVYASAFSKLTSDQETISMLNGFAEYSQNGYFRNIGIDPGKLSKIMALMGELTKAIDHTKENGFAKFSEIREYSSVSGVKALFNKVDSVNRNISDLLKVMDRSYRAVQQILTNFHTIRFENMNSVQRNALRHQMEVVMRLVSTFKTLLGGFYSIGINVGRVFLKAKQVTAENHGSDVRDTTAVHGGEQNRQQQHALPA